MNIDNVRQAAQLMTRASSLLGGGPLEYYLTELTGANDFLMGRFCPLKIGDRVMLTQAPATDNGWCGHSKLLVRGALGTVAKAECGSKGFNFYVTFDEDPEEDKYHFNFGENYLTKVTG